MKWLIILLSLSVTVNCSCDFHYHNVDEYFNLMIVDNLSKLHIFDFAGIAPSFWKSWNVLSVNIKNLKSEEFDFYYGVNESHVHGLCELSQSYYHFDYFIGKFNDLLFGRNANQLNFDFNPFAKLSFGIKLKRPNPMIVSVTSRFNVSLFVLTLTSIVLFLMARRLSESLVFHFSCGICIGLFASILMVMFVLSRVLPFRKTFFAIGVLGSSVCASLFIHMKDQIWPFIEGHLFAAVIYVLVVGFVSGIAIYYYYPEQVNRKTVNIINLCLKLLAISMLWFSVHIMYTFCVLTFVIAICPYMVNYSTNRMIGLWRRNFPRKRKYISPTKYPRILTENTNRELENFRNYLKSPQFDTWRAIRQCHDIDRLAQFVDSGCHVNAAEMDSYAAVEDDDMELSQETDSSIEFN